MALALAVAGCSTAPPEAMKAEDLPKAFVTTTMPTLLKVHLPSAMS
ncbi:MAG: hypothetical protein KGI68_11940 [Alphaproteobacteria bacterium]|nr:hypothetical protein [Alphaproteobacteria bacterium]MDE2499885.1 hypothetical protein [Alphaproteobacteria bacterium]